MQPVMSEAQDIGIGTLQGNYIRLKAARDRLYSIMYKLALENVTSQ